MSGIFEQFDKFSKTVPDGDNRERMVCGDCGWIHYDNPKMVVGALVTSGDKFLLCKRAIQPRAGYWTLPAGFMEEHETTEAGAKRETMEEACAEIEIENLLAVYSVPHISQVQLMYKATLLGSFAPGPESTDVQLFAWDDIPWDELAFPTVAWALRQYRGLNGQKVYAPFTNPEGQTGLPKRR